MKKVTGIGGVMFKARDPEKLMEWYDKNLGIKFTHGFMEFTWADESGGKVSGSTVLSISKEDSDHFKPSKKPYMINFRVVDLRALLGELRERGVTIIGDVQDLDFGRFGSIMDPEGNKIELWEPIEKEA